MKEYEVNYEKLPVNFQAIILISLILGVVGIFYYPILSDIITPTSKPIEPITTPNISTVIQIEYITVLVTPTPDGITYYANEYQTGIRKLNKTFTFTRTDVSGLKDMVVHSKVYDYRLLDYYTWFNPTDYKYYHQYPIDKNNKFLFVFVQSYMDDTTGDDTRIWLPNTDLYGVQYQDKVYSPIEFVKQLRIKELEETFNLNDDYRIGYYGTQKYFEYGHPETAGETYDELTWLRGGKSNAIDGYIVYEIPKEAQPQDLTVLASYYSFGNVGWRLIP